MSHGGWVVLYSLCIVCGFSGAAFSKRNGKNVQIDLIHLALISMVVQVEFTAPYARVWRQFFVVAKNRTIIQVTVLLARAVQYQRVP